MQAYQATSNKRGNCEDGGGRTEGNDLQQHVTIVEDAKPGWRQRKGLHSI